MGPPLRLVTRASHSSHSSPAPRRGGRVSNPPLREVTWVIGVIGGAGMGSRLHGNDGREPGMGSPYRVRGRLRLHGNDEWEPGMGSRLHGNDGLVAGDGFPFARERRSGAGDGFPVSSTGQAPFARERRWWVAGFFTPHLPAGGHVGPPLRLVTRASPSSHSSPAPRRGGRVSNPPLPEVIRVIGVIWERGRDCLNQDLWD